MLRNLREVIRYVTDHEPEFIQYAADSGKREQDAELVRKQETLSKADKRIKELDTIISHL